MRLAATGQGRVFSPAWRVDTPAPSAWIPSPVAASRPTLLRPVRGKFTPCPPTQSSPGSPWRRRPARGLPRRRGRFDFTPATQPPPPRPGRRRAALPVVRRGTLVEPTWPPAAPPPPPAYTPRVAKGRRGVPALRLHGRMMPGWMDLTVMPVVDGAAVLASTSHPIATMTTTSSAHAWLASSDTPTASIGGDE
ncbi:hypothetical protein [Nonomuraea sp. NPDC002799]